MINKLIKKIKQILILNTEGAYSECYCPNCEHEILRDKLSKIYEGGTFTNIICSKCGAQSKWDLDAPVPLFLEEVILKK
jgi:transposase-like protein